MNVRFAVPVLISVGVLGSGVIDAVQFGAVPENAIPEFGTSPVLPELAVTDEPQATVSSASLIVKLTEVEDDSCTVLAEIAEILGGSFTGAIERLTV